MSGCHRPGERLDVGDLVLDVDLAPGPGIGPVLASDDTQHPVPVRELAREPRVASPVVESAATMITVTGPRPWS
jgi:hypothetical protein